MKPVKKDPEDARQGERGPSMIAVLGFGIAVTVVVFVILGWMNSDGDMASIGVVGDDPALNSDASPSAAVDGARDGVERDDTNNLQHQGTASDTPDGSDATRPLEEG